METTSQHIDVYLQTAYLYQRRTWRRIKHFIYPMLTMLKLSTEVVINTLTSLRGNLPLFLEDAAISMCPSIVMDFFSGIFCFTKIIVAAYYLVLLRMLGYGIGMDAEKKELREVVERFHETAWNTNMGNIFGTTLFSEEDFEVIQKAAKYFKDLQKNLNITKIVGSTMGLFGGALSIIGAALVPFTFGASIALTVIGVTVGVASGGVSIGSTIINIRGKLHARKNVDPVLLKLIVIAKTVRDVTIYLAKLEQWFMNEMERPNTFSNANYYRNAKLHILYALEELKKIENPLIQMTEKLTILRSQLLRVTEVLSSVATRNAEGYDDWENSQERFHKAISVIADVTREGSKPLGRFLNDFYGLQRIEGSDAPSMASFSDLVYLQTGTFAIERCAVITTDVATTLSDDVLRSAFTSSARAVPVVGIVLGAVGIVLDAGILIFAIKNACDDHKEPLQDTLITFYEFMNKLNGICNDYPKQTNRFGSLCFVTLFSVILTYCLFIDFILLKIKWATEELTNYLTATRKH